jgi:hypothetical protein
MRTRTPLAALAVLTTTLLTKRSPVRIAALVVGGILVALEYWLALFSGHYMSTYLPTFMAISGALYAKKNNRDVVAWALLLALFPLPAGIVLAIIDHKRRKALGLKWYQRERAHTVTAHERTQERTGSITRHNSPDINHDNERLPSAAIRWGDDDYKRWFGNVDGARYKDRLVWFTVFMVMVAPISVFCLYIMISGNG